MSDNGFKVKVVDLDIQQATITDWHRRRLDNGLDPIGSVETFRSFSEALDGCDGYDFVVVDGVPRASESTLEITKASVLIVQPTGASIDDLQPAIRLFHELINKGVERKKLFLALSRVGTEAEINDSKDYIKIAGYKTLDGFILERPSYRQAQNDGKTIAETQYQLLNDKVDVLVQSIFDNFEKLTKVYNSKH